MSAMVLEADKVSSLVIPNLTKTKSNLDEAYKLSNTLMNKLPSSASSRNRLNDLRKKINTASTNVNTISIKLDSKLDKAKNIETKNKTKTAGIAAAVSAVTGAAGAALGVATGGVKGAVIGGAVGAAVGVAVTKTKTVTSVGKALKNTGAKVAKNVCNFFKSIGRGLKKIGKSIANACKKIANKVVSFVKEKIGPIIKKIGQAALSVVKFLGRCAATVVNLAISLVEGICSFVEAIGDVVLIVVGGVCSIVTALADIVRGVCTGEWDWKCTSAVWKKWVMPWVGYDWTSKWAFSWASGSFIDDAAFSWAKRDGGLGYKIGKGVGYVVGIVVASIFTAGGAAAASSAASTAASAASSVAAKTALTVTAKVAGSLATKTAASTLLAGLGKAGKAASSGYNSAIDSQVKSHYIEQLRLQNSSLSDEQLSDLFNQYKKDGKFTDYNAIRKSAMDNISGGKIAGVLGSAAVQGGIEAATWYVTYGKGGGNLEGTKLAKLGNVLTSRYQWYKPTSTLGKMFLNKIGPASVTKAGIQMAKELGNEIATVMYDGKIDWKTAGTNAIVSGATSIIYDNTVSEWMGNALKKLPEVTKATAEAQLSEVADDGMTAGASEVSETFMQRVTDLSKKGARIALDYAKNNDGGKKVVGGGIKNILKEGEKDLIEQIQEKISGGE